MDGQLFEVNGSMNQIVYDHDLSIVVQGAIDWSHSARKFATETTPITKMCLASIRKQFPKAEIILSTWEGSETGGLHYDKLVLSRDPGSHIFDDSRGRFLNVNRQIVSAFNGIRRATRKYVLKVRSDMYFINNRALSLLKGDLQRCVEYKVSRHRVIITNISTVNPAKAYQCPFHACDWFFLGTKEDLIDIFDIPLMPSPEYTRWYESHPFPVNHPDRTNLSRYNPECYIWSSYLKKYLDLTFNHTSDNSSENVAISEWIFANNTIIYSAYQLGFKSLKYEWPASHLINYYNHCQWKELYRKYVLRRKLVLKYPCISQEIGLLSSYNNYGISTPTMDDPLGFGTFLKLLVLAPLKAICFYSKRTLMSVTSCYCQERIKSKVLNRGGHEFFV